MTTYSLPLPSIGGGIFPAVTSGVCLLHVVFAAAAQTTE